jgi:putative oxidoreductase
MLTSLQNSLALVGRLLLALVFLPAGISKVTGFAGMVGYTASVGMPLPQVATAIALVIEIVGGIALIVGFGTRWAALALAFFTLVASFFFHNYWTLPADQQMIQQLMFFKNIGLVGGLLVLAAHGAGAWSLDAKRQA